MVRSTNPTPATVERLVVVPDATTPLQAGLKITPTAEPTYHEAGDVYVNSTTYAPYVSNGTVWVPASGYAPVYKAPTTLTAEDNGALCVFDTAAGMLFTLPAAVAGLRFRFVVETTCTSGVHRIACASGDFLVGTILQIIDTTFAPTARDADGSTHLAWEGNGTTTGGIKGDFIEVHAVSGTQWQVWGINTATGSEATPFKTS